MSRIYNFSAGPSILPDSVLETAQKELMDYQMTGMSVLEMSHRSKDFMEIFTEARQSLRELLRLPETHEILFLQGGATLQFAMVPMNLMKNHKKAVYINTGTWANKAIKEAEKFGQVTLLGDSSDQNFSYIPIVPWNQCPQDIDYIHITSNNTIHGTVYHQWPDVKNIPLVVDMSSNILSDDTDISQADLVYAGAQKNIGPAGLTIVIISKKLAQDCSSNNNPLLLNYQKHIEAASMINTPPCFNIYIANNVFQWIKTMGGLSVMKEKNCQKSQLLYTAIDDLDMFHSLVAKKDRSLMNIPFSTESEKLDTLFVTHATQQGLVNLKGHRSVGGMRASIYNAMPIDGVKKLVRFMEDFSQKHSSK